MPESEPAPDLAELAKVKAKITARDPLVKALTATADAEDK